MALVDSVFAGKLKGIFAQMRAASETEHPLDDDWFADNLAKLIDDQIKTADVQMGITVTGGTVSGGSLVGCATSALGKLN